MLAHMFGASADADRVTQCAVNAGNVLSGFQLPWSADGAGVFKDARNSAMSNNLYGLGDSGGEFAASLHGCKIPI